MAIAFIAPWDSGTYSITLKSPSFHNMEQFLLNTIILTAMDGTIYTRRKPLTEKKLQITLRDLSRSKALELRQFLLDSSGIETRYIDSFGQAWKGWILTNPNEIITDSRGPGSEPRPESNTVTLEFQGVKIV